MLIVVELAGQAAATGSLRWERRRQRHNRGEPVAVFADPTIHDPRTLFS
ncbi:MAG: hypothetical protein M3O70_19475 [Actinomycetota bacterium]|nr:hypothetical protein [Actinomycetota bacterium]